MSKAKGLDWNLGMTQLAARCGCLITFGSSTDVIVT